MPRYIRNTAILAKIEGTAGVDANPAGTDVLMVSDLSITPLEATNIDRGLVRAFFGASEQLVGSAFVRMGFTVELAGSGTAGTAPQLGKLLKACASAEASLTAPARNEYTPITSSLQTITLYWYDDGVLHKGLAAMGNAKLSAVAGDRPKLAFEFMALDGGISAATPSGIDYTSWKTPPVVKRQSVVDVTLGGTYAAGAITGGTLYGSRGLEMDIGNSVNFTALLSTEGIDITDRQSSGHIDLDISAPQEVTLMAAVKANATQSLAFTVGTAAGNKWLIYAPAVQLFNPTKQEVNGRRLCGYDLRFVPVNGNDEWRLVAL